MVIAIFIGIAIYFYAGWVISEITIEMFDNSGKRGDYQNALKAVWGTKTTTLVLRTILIFFWAIAFFPGRGEAIKIIKLKNK